MKISTTLSLLLAAMLLSGCRHESEITAPPADTTQSVFPKIDRHPPPLVFNRGRLPTLPTYDPTHPDGFQVDLRHFDLSHFELLDLYRRLEDLLHADFDDQTIWPDTSELPPGFDPDQIMELGKNPGLGIRSLHAQGVTGKNVGIAIIDQSLLVDHQEYADQLRLYEEPDGAINDYASMHGAAVASIAVGKTTGVAPEADLYFIATAFGGDNRDFSCFAQGIDRILEINQTLPENRKIRVISMQIGWTTEATGYNEITRAANDAKAEDMLVVCSSIERVHGLKFHGLGREPRNDPELSESYEPGSWWANDFYANTDWYSDRLMVPMDS